MVGSRLVRADTGSGKTLAYCVPMIEWLARQSEIKPLSRDDGLFGVVVCPTRELALQVIDVLSALMNAFPWLVVGAIIGGEKRKSEKARLRKGVNVLVATPGRLLDHLQHTDNINVRHLSWLVLDEADRLLDMGFERDVTTCVSLLEERSGCKVAEWHMAMMTATLTGSLIDLANTLMPRPLFLGIDKHGDRVVSDDLTTVQDTAALSSTPKQLTNWYAEVPMKQRLLALAAFVLQRQQYVARRVCVGAPGLR